ncbi:MAG: GNAT family N-acetyltransferase [Saprospiraceae bacterium]|nr:GNAT family N-acetyltransferase [Saprospiraceae bacterium]
MLVTKRLRLRQFTYADAPFLIELLNSPGWLEFIGDKNVKTEKQAIQYLKNGPMKSYHENGFGLSLVESIDNKTFIGCCGMIKRDTHETPDIGFAFLPQFQGLGYAFEIASATMLYAQEQLHFTKISAITSLTNFRSIKLLEKMGFKYERAIHVSREEEEVLYYSN